MLKLASDQSCLIIALAPVPEYAKCHTADVPTAAVIACRGASWGSLRAGAQPMFHSAILATYATTINSAVNVYTGKLDAFHCCLCMTAW